MNSNTPEDGDPVKDAMKDEIERTMRDAEAAVDGAKEPVEPVEPDGVEDSGGGADADQIEAWVSEIGLALLLG